MPEKIAVIQSPLSPDALLDLLRTGGSLKCRTELPAELQAVGVRGAIFKVGKDATFRVVAANLGISIVPAEVGRTYARLFDMKIVALTDSWAERRFAVCFKDYEALQPAARRLVEHLTMCPAARRRENES